MRPILAFASNAASFRLRRVAYSATIACLAAALSAGGQQNSPSGAAGSSASSSLSGFEDQAAQGSSAGTGANQSQGAGLTDSSGAPIDPGLAAGTNPNPTPYGRLANGAPISLSADQIFAVLQAEPDTMLELKSLAADLAQQQGTPLAPDSITDDMLYRKIASSAELRSNITTFLRARGYEMDDNLATYAAGSGDGDATSSWLQLPQTSGQFPANATFPFGPLFDPSLSAGASPNRPDAMRSSYPPYPIARPRTAAPREPEVLHEPTPYNLLSLRDLYTQLPEQNGPLKRFGSDVFLRRSAFSPNQLAPNMNQTPLDVPAGAAYIVGPGDTLAIDLWGGISQSFTRVIDRDGKLDLPEAGAVQVAGLTLERSEGVIAEALRRQYRDLQVAVTVARLRTIRIFVVGDVQRPGAYDINSLSTPLNALYAAGGPTSVGSLRVLRHYRGKQLVGEIDLYDFLLHGVQSEDRLQAGDSLLAPPAGPQVTVYGAVKRPAIYELKGDATLAGVLEEAGGATVSAELGHIVIDRVDANRQRETVTLELPASSSPETARSAIAAFPVHDGDRIHVSPILPYSQRLIYVTGHVARPGRMPYRDGMQLSDILRSYRDLLPEPADRGEIIRLVPPDLHPETISFNVPEVLIGNGAIALEPFDTVRVFGRYETDAPQVTINGEVLRPGLYSLSEGMTAAQLVRMAGGFKRDALLSEADLTSYQIVGGTRVVSERSSIPIGAAVERNDRDGNVALKPGDVLTIHQLTGWNDIGASITLEGEVAHPGTYGFEQGERLSSVLRRAGGFRETSYAEGAVLIREDVRKLEEKSREELIRQIETSSAAARIKPAIGAGDQSATLQLVQQQQTDIVARLRSQPASGRLVIHVSADIGSWENTPADIEVRSGDVLRVPKRPGFVLVSGQVYNSSAITFDPGKTAGWYLRHAGGANEIANKADIFIVRANGSVIGRGSSSRFGHDVLSTTLEPGDVVVVPQKILGASVFWRNLLTVAQIASSTAITAGIAGLL